MRRAVTWLLLLTAPATVAGANEEPPVGKLVLDETAYCRAHVQFGMDRLSPGGLRADGETVLGKGQMRRLKSGVRRREGDDFDEDRWMEKVTCSFQWLQYGGSRDRANPYAYTDPPAAAWTGVDFDDTGWLYQRKPFMVGRTYGWFRRAGYFRFRFSVPDPRRAGKLTLELLYRGGARVFLNGRELARGHLPAGEIGPETRGADYPLAAYVKLKPDGTPYSYKDHRGRGTELVHVGELPASWDQAERIRDRKTRKPVPGVRRVFGRSVDRETFDRACKLRRRVIGPLALPADLLRKGVNVLAVEVRASDIHPVSLAGRKNWRTPYYGRVDWSHGQLTRMALRAAGGDVPSVLRRPPGVRVRAEDMHRPMVSSEFLQAGVPTGPLRFAGAAGGRFGGQVVIGADRALADVKVTAGDLKAPGGAALPAGCIRLHAMPPHTLHEWHTLGWGRGGMPHCQRPLAGPAGLALARHGPDGVEDMSREEKIEALKTLRFFDHVADAAPAGKALGVSVPANSCRPVWVTLEVPRDAAPGTYEGELRVEAPGARPMTVAVVADVAGWLVPAPRDFQAHAALEQSPYGVARRYGVPLWSDEHFRLMEGSFRRLAEVGNDWLNVPIINYTEFGNLTDSMVRWVRRDGADPPGLDFDFTVLDRYLDLAIRHLGKPRVINFIVMHGTVGDEADVQVLEEPTGRVRTVRLGNRREGYAPHWKAFASALHAHLRDRGLDDVMYWGFIWDSVADAELVRLLASVTPGVWWTAGAHRGKEHFWVRAFSQLLPFRLTAHSQRGWRNPEFHVLLPRGGGSLVAAPGTAFPFNFRLAVDRSLVVGMNGVGRMGADYWGDTYIKGMRKEGWLRAGMPNHFMLWPGPRGAESSARFAALREGFQETEARIFLEQLLARGALPEELAARVEQVLFEHHRGTLFIPSMNASHKHVELCRDWQARSRRLFGAAAEAAAACGLDPDCYGRRRDGKGKSAVVCRIDAEVPARGRRTVPLKLRSWTGRPRAWKLAADAPWIVPGKAAGTTVGHETVPITIDATDLPPGRTATGTLTITDATGGRTHTAAVAAVVSEVFDYASPTDTLPRKEMAFIPDDGREVIHVVPPRRARRAVSFFNRAACPIGWKASASLRWLSVTPAAGRAGPGDRVTVQVEAAPAAGDAGLHEAVLTITEADPPAGADGAVERVPLAVYALRPHREPPTPKGRSVLMDKELFEAMARSQRAWRPRWCAHGLGGFRMTEGGRTERGEKVGNCFTLTTPYEVVFSLEGRDFHAMSAKVDLPDPKQYKGYKYWNAGHGPPPEWIRVRFEVYVDGRLRAASDWRSVHDDIQTLVVDGLDGAKRMRWVTRFEKYPPAAVTAAWWDVRFYKAG